MIIYRLSNSEFANDLSGNGSKLYGGRWNSVGVNALYTTENISLAVLEILVHIKLFKLPPHYNLVSIEIPRTIEPVIISHKKLKQSWKDDVAYSQFIGNEFLRSSQGLILKVPSVIIEQENNFIINPKHPDIKKVMITENKVFEFDKRLYLKNE